MADFISRAVAEAVIDEMLGERLRELLAAEVERDTLRADLVTVLPEVRFMTVKEVATFLRVSKMTVYRLVHEGQLDAVRVGRQMRVPEDAVARYVAKDADAEPADG